MDILLEFLLRSLVALAVALFVVGLFKPIWVWRWRGEPNRLLITAVAFGLFIAGFTGLGEMSESGGNELERQLGAEILSKTAYQIGPQTKRCEPGSRPGGAGVTDDESGPEGIEYNVRTPVNYDPTIAHPLLMVYAPYGKSRNRTEQFTYLTREATAAGFIISYADHKRLAPETIIELSGISRKNGAWTRIACF